METDPLADALLRRGFLSRDDLKPPRLLPPSLDLSAGEPFGRYIVVRPLGEGGLGRVVLAVDPLLQRHVALKLLKRGLPEDFQRFEREARLAAQLSHPNIVPVYESGQVGDQPYIAMAYVEGTMLQESTADLPSKLATAVKIARALGHAHARGIVHRDVKPENLLVRPDGEPVVMDLGLAKRYGRDSQQITAPGYVGGTPAYMSPEQVRAEPELTAASDVFSLGSTLYFWLAGRRPFDGRTAEELALAITGRRPEPLRERVPELSPAVEAVILRALEKRPESRWQDGEAMAAALEAALSMPAELPRGCATMAFRWRRGAR